MRIAVCLKRVPDTTTKVVVAGDGKSIDPTGVKFVPNPYDEYALEAAIALKEAAGAGEKVVLSLGGDPAQETIRTALAMGIDRGIHVLTDKELQPLAVAKLLKAVADEERPGLVLMGKQAIDGDNNATGQMLAALADWPQATFASKLEVAGDKARVTREVDGGLQTLEVDLPAVVTADLRLNEPRYASLPNIMKAKKKVIEVKPADFGVDIAPRLSVTKVCEPPKRGGGVKVENASDLVMKLKNEAGVL